VNSRLTKPICLIALLIASSALALETNTLTAPTVTNAPALQSEAETLSGSTHAPSASTERFFKKRPTVSVGKKIVQAPRRLLRAINPFAPAEAKETLEFPADLTPRAWTTTIGWHSGGPRFDNPTTHESSLGLFHLGD